MLKNIFKDTNKVMNKRNLNWLVNFLMIIIGIHSTISNYTGEFTIMYATSIVVLWAGTLGTILTAYKYRFAGAPNLVQNLFNVFVSGSNRVIGDAAMAAFYALFEARSLWTWNKNKDENNKVQTTDEFDWKKILVQILISTIGLGILSYVLGGQKIILDSINNGTAITAQYLQKEKRQNISWALWGVTNLIGIVIFLEINPIQSAMYTAFLLNTVRGYINWTTE